MEKEEDKKQTPSIFIPQPPQNAPPKKKEKKHKNKDSKKEAKKKNSILTIKEFINTLVGLCETKNIIKILNSNNVDSIEKLKQWNTMDLCGCGIKMNDAVVIKRALEVRFQKQKSLPKLPSIPIEELDLIRENIKKKEGASKLNDKNIKQEEIKKEQNSDVSAPTPIVQEQLPVQKKFTILYVLKTPQILVTEYKDLLPQSAQYQEMYIDQEDYILFLNEEERNKFFDINKEVQVVDKKVPLKKGVLIKLNIPTEICYALMRKITYLNAIISKFDGCKLVGITAKKELKFFASALDFQPLVKELEEGICNLKFKNIKNNNIKIGNRKLDTLAYTDLQSKNFSKIEVETDTIIAPKKIMKNNKGEARQTIILISKKKEQLNEAESRIRKMEIISEFTKISIPCKKPKSEKKSNKLQENVAGKEHRKEQRKVGKKSQESTVEQKIKPIEQAVDGEDTKSSLESELKPDEENHQENEEDENEDLMKLMQTNKMKIINELTQKYNVGIVASVDHEVRKDHKDKNYFNIDVCVYGLDKKDIKAVILDFISEVKYFGEINFCDEGDNPLKGAIALSKVQEIKNFAKPKGVNVSVKFNYDYQLGKVIKSDIHLGGMKSGVMLVREYILGMMENFVIYPVTIKKAFPPLLDKFEFAKKDYAKSIRIGTNRYIERYVKGQLTHCASDIKVDVDPNFNIIANIEIGTIDKPQLVNVETNLKIALDDFVVETLKSQPLLIEKIKKREISKIEFRKKTHVDLLIDFKDVKLIGHKEDVEAAKKELMGERIFNKKHALNEIYKYFVSKRLDSHFPKIEKETGCRIFIRRGEFSVNIFGPEKGVAEALLKVQSLEKEIIEKSTIEKTVCDSQDLQALKNNISKIEHISRINNVDISLFDTQINISKAKTTLGNNIKIDVREGNILDDRDVEIIVNSANANLQHNSGVAFDIATAAGPRLVEECQKLVAARKLKIGEVVKTNSGALRYKFVFHAIVPIFKENTSECIKELKETVTNVLIEANKMKITSLAMPCFCSGAFGFPQSLAASTILDAISQYKQNQTIREIHLVDTNRGAIEQFKVLLKEPETIDKILSESVKEKINWRPQHQWYWNHHEEGKMEKYDPDQNYHIDYAYVFLYPKGQKEVSFIGDLGKIKNSKNYKINFDEMMQQNVQSGYKRDVKKEPMPISGINPIIKKSEENKNEDNSDDDDAEDSLPNSELEEDKNQDKANSMFVIIGQTSTEVMKAIGMVKEILKSLKQPYQINLPRKLNKAEEDHIKEIISQNKCEVNISPDGKYMIINGYSEQTRIAEIEFYKYLSSLQTTGSDGFQVPAFWEPQSDPLQIFDVQLGTKEFNDVQVYFQKTMPGIPIKKLERIQNLRLWDNFAHEIKKLTLKYGKEPKRQKLFHGTRSNEPINIYGGDEVGFDMRFCTSGMWGIGVYFATKSSYSNGYAYTKTYKQMFLADVIVGDFYYCDPNSSLRMPPVKPGTKNQRFDSVSGTTCETQVFIIYENSKAYPQYLITY